MENKNCCFISNQKYWDNNNVHAKIIGTGGLSAFVCLH